VYYIYNIYKILLVLGFYHVQVTWRKSNEKYKDRWNFYSVKDNFENGASFNVTKGIGVQKPNYNKEQNFEVVDAKFVRSLTRSSGMLQFNKIL